MMELDLSALLSSPLHPMVVHFPIALLATGAVFDALCLVIRSRLWLDRTATALLVIGGATLGAAYLTGERAAEAAAPITGAAQGVLADHEDLALLTIWVTAAAMAVRLFVSWLGRDDLEVRIGIFRLLALILVFGAVFLLAVTAHHGGQLVFDYGIGVVPPG